MTFRSMTLPLFALVAALAGCTEAGTSAGTESTAGAQSPMVSEQSAKVDVVRGMRGRMRPMAHRAPGGSDFLVHAALRAPINLTAEQKATIETLVKPSASREHEADPARAQKLAAAIRSNSVAALEQPKLDESKREARIAASAKTLATLHDTLTPEQRVALVDSMAKRASEHGQERGDHVRKGAQREHGDHGERGDRAGRERGFRPHGGPGGGPMGMLAGLELTPAQKEAIKTQLDAQRPAKPTAEQREAMKAKMESMRAEMKAKLESFKANEFDATAFATPPKVDRPEMKAHGKNPLAVITSVLTPEQRETLAARIEKGPAAHAARMNAPSARQANAPAAK